MSELQTDVELETKKTSTNIRLRVKMKRTKKSPPTSESLLDSVPILTPASPPKIRSNYCRGIFMDKNDCHFSTVKPEVVDDYDQENKQPARSDLDLPWLWTASSGHSSESGTNAVCYSATTAVPTNESIIPYKNIYRNRKDLQTRVSLSQGFKKPGKLWGMSGMLVTRNFASCHLGVSDTNNIANGEKDDYFTPHSETDDNMLESDHSIFRSVTGSDNIIGHYGRCSSSSSSHTNCYKLSCSDVGIQPSSSASSFEDEEVVCDEIDFREINMIASTVNYINTPIDIPGAQTLSHLPLTLVPDSDQSPICHDHNIAKCLHELHSGKEGRALAVHMDDIHVCPEADDSADEFYSEDDENGSSNTSSDEILPILDRITRGFSWTNLIPESEKPISPTLGAMGSVIASDVRIPICVFEDSSDDQELKDAVSRLDLTANERAKASSTSKIIVKSSLFNKKDTTSDIGPIVHTKLPIVPSLQKSDMFNDAASFLLYNVSIPPKRNTRRKVEETSSSTSNCDVIPLLESEDTSSSDDMAEAEILENVDFACIPQVVAESTSVFLRSSSICEMDDAGQKLSETSSSSTPTKDYSTSPEDGMEAEFDIKEPIYVGSSIHVVSVSRYVDECPEASMPEVVGSSSSAHGTESNVRVTTSGSRDISVDEKNRLCTCLEYNEEGISEITQLEANDSESSKNENDREIDAILRTTLALTAMTNDLSRSSSELDEGCEENAKKLASLQSIVNSSLNRLMKLAQALADANDEEMKAHSHEMQMEIRHLESMVWRLKDEVEKLAFCMGKQDCKQELLSTRKLFEDMRKTKDELLQEVLRARYVNLGLNVLLDQTPLQQQHEVM